MNSQNHQRNNDQHQVLRNGHLKDKNRYHQERIHKYKNQQRHPVIDHEIDYFDEDLVAESCQYC